VAHADERADVRVQPGIERRLAGGAGMGTFVNVVVWSGQRAYLLSMDRLTVR
jgi:hypothetical protein